MQSGIENVDRMDEAEERRFWDAFGAELAEEDGGAAKEHLAAGFPIYFCEDDTPEGLVIREQPDGRRELISLDEDGEKIVRVLG